MAAPLVSAGSLGGFQASCGATGCSGSYDGDAFTFDGPFPDGRAPEQNDPSSSYNPFIDFSIGTNGGVFTSGGQTCDHDVELGGGTCNGEVAFGADIGPPFAGGLSLGELVSVKGTGTAEGFFCWEAECLSGGQSVPLFNVNVNATYEFTLTNPGTPEPFTWTAAQFNLVPEPGTLVLATLGLVGVAAGWRGRRCRL